MKPTDHSHAPGLFDEGTNCCKVAQAGRVAFVVDGAAYFAAFRKAAERAERSITLLAWDFDSSTLLDPGDPKSKVGDFLNDLARRRRGLHIRVLDWDFPRVFGADREFSPSHVLSKWKPHRRVHFRYDNTHPVAGSQHQKIAAFDDKVAFVGGLDITTKRWDTPEHRPDDPHRVSGGKPYPPFHDMMAVVDGEAARVLAGVARFRWERATGEALQAVETDGDPWPSSVEPALHDVALAISCTDPERPGRPEVRHVERLYLDMIARAKRYIYIENQYFTSHLIGEALAARLAEADSPEIVLVTRLLSHGWLEEVTMHVLRTRLIQALRKADTRGRFRVYYPHVEGLAEGTCIDVHSKMMAVDDEWLRIGSANLSNRSMGLDTECDVTLEAGGKAGVPQVIHAFRNQLLAEHLGVAPDAVARAEDTAGSLIGAIESLRGPARSLRALEDLKDWPEPLVEAIAITDPEKPVSLDALLEQFTPGEESGHRGLLVRIAGFAAFLCAIALAWHYTPLAEWLTVERVSALAEDFGHRWWAPFAVVLAYTPASMLLIPRPLITLAATIAFGAWLGFAYGMAGILLAGAATYGLGRLLKRETVHRIAGPRVTQICETVKAHGLPAVIAARFVPIAPFWVINMVAGAIRIRFWHFMVGTSLGILPGVLAATVFGDQFGDALKDPGGVNYWYIAGMVVFFGLMFIIVRRWVNQARPAPSKPEDPPPRRRRLANVT